MVGRCGHTVILFTAALLLLAGCQKDRGPASGKHEGPVVSEGGGISEGAVISEATAWVTCVDTVRRGDTFSSLLLRNRLYLRDVEQIIQEVRQTGLFRLRGLRPGEQVEVCLDLDGRVQRLRYEQSPDRIYVIEREGEVLRSYQTGLPYDTYVRKIAGTLRTTVDEALRRAGAPPEVALELAEIFASDIDFLTEPRMGDRIVVLLEEKRYEGARVGFGQILFASYAGKKVCQSAVRFPCGQRRSRGAGCYYTPEGESLVRTFLRSPLNYRRISSRFSKNRFHPILRVWRPHLGVDYAAAPGTPVVAIGDGVVSLAGWNGGFGRQICIRHGEDYETSYGHLSRIARGVRNGARVKKGQVIGFVGSTGLSTGPHLDFRVKCNGRFIDPLRMKNPPAAPVPETLRERFLARVTQLAEFADSLNAGEAVWVSGASAVLGAAVNGGLPPGSARERS
ncbi:MAG: M23 family metallopeptidase [Candidatus Eisenbacteria sp.]|nr:M23 family metallopeptidase [Candidatus Eisenbacteria bacterium]